MHQDEALKLVDAFVDFKLKNEGCSINTHSTYRMFLVKLLAFLSEVKTDLPSVNQRMLEEFVGPWLFKNKLSAKSRRLAVCALKGFFGYLQKKGHRKDNPALELKYPKAGLRLPKFMQLNDVQKLVHQPDTSTFVGLRDLAMMMVFLGCGLRVSELCNLNESNLIFGLDDSGDETLLIRLVGKGNKERIVYAPDDARLALRAYMGHPKMDEIDRHLDNGDQVLFASIGSRQVPMHEYRGEERRIHPRSVHEIIMRYGLQAGLPKDVLHPHALRHTFATEMVEEDTNMLNLQAILGHASADTTAIYTHTAVRKMIKDVRKGNPLAKIRTPFTELADALKSKSK